MVRQINKTEAKRSNTKRNVWITLLAVILVALIATATFAWFLSRLQVDGIDTKTGKFQYQFAGYHVDGDTLEEDFAYSTQNEDGFELISTDESFNLALRAESTLNMPINTESSKEIYYVVRKLDDSVDLDVSVRLNAEIYKIKNPVITNENGETVVVDPVELTEIVGGFWYQISSWTVSGTGVDNIEQVVNDASKNPVPDIKERNFLNIRNELKSAELYGDTKYMVFRLCYGMGETASSLDYLDATLNIVPTLVVSQKGGQPGDSANRTHNVTTLAELEEALLSYKEDDIINVLGDIVYTGDLNINRPVTLNLSNNLTVNGDVRFTYTAAGTFNMAFQGGTLTINQMENVSAGGNLYLEIPNAQMNITANGADAENGHLIIENQFIASVNYGESENENGQLSDSKNQGLVLSSVDIRGIDGALKDVYLREVSKLTVGYNTTIGRVAVLNNSSSDTTKDTYSVFILNYGTINNINLSNMKSTFGTTVYPNPRILIDNYGTVTNAIVLPYWSAKYDANNHDDISGSNTRIIQRNPSPTMEVIAVEKYTSADIERPETFAFIQATEGGSHVTVYYMDTENYVNPEVDFDETIRNLFEYYMGNTCKDYERISNDFTLIKSMQIICSPSGNEYRLTAADYEYIRTHFTHLEELDLSQADSIGEDGKVGKVPNLAFQNMTALKKLTMSARDTEWGANLFEGATSLDELTLGSALTEISQDAFEGSSIKYLHIGSKAQLLIDDMSETLLKSFADATRKPEMYLFCLNDATRDALITKIGELCGNQDIKQLMTSSAPNPNLVTLMTKISTIFLDAERVGDYFGKFYEGSSSCEIMTYVGNDFNWENEFRGPHSFNFRTFTKDGKSYQVTGYDDFAFFGMTVGQTQTGTGSANVFEFSAALASIGDAAFFGSITGYDNINLNGCRTVGHLALANNSYKNLAGTAVTSAGFLAFGGNTSTEVNFINLPRLRTVYGVPFGTATYAPARIDIGYVQLASDANAAITQGSEFYALYANCNLNFNNTAIIIHTVTEETYGDALALQNGLVETKKSNAVMAPEALKEALVGYYQVKTDKINGFFSFGTSSATYMGVLKMDGTIVTDNLYDVGDLVFIQDGNTYKLLKCITAGALSANDGTLTIPAYNSASVIGARAFVDQKFEHVNTLTFAESYKTIEKEAFSASSSDKAVTNKYYLHLDLNLVEMVGENAFRNTPSLLTVVGTQVTSVGRYGFNGCGNLRTVSMSNLRSTYQSFQGCGKLEMVFVGPIYGDGAFNLCGELKAVFVNAGTTEITQSAYLTGTSSAVNFDVIVLGPDTAFGWDKSKYDGTTKKIYIDEDINNIVFAELIKKDAGSVTIASGVTETYSYELPTYMFTANDNNLTLQLTFDLKARLTEQFRDGTHSYAVPATLYADTDGEPYVSLIGTSGNRYSVTQNDGESSTGYKVVGIADNCYQNVFVGDYALTAITFPNDMEYIGKNAFENGVLGSVTIDGNDSLVIAEKAFYHSTIADSLAITGVQTIGISAFEGVLGSVSITGNGSLEIAEKAFYHTTIKTSLAITGVKTIGVSAFEGVHDVDANDQNVAITVSLGDDLTTVGDSAFENAWVSQLTTSHIDGSIEGTLDLGIDSFRNMTSGDGEISKVDFGKAEVMFGVGSFTGTKITTLSAQRMRAVSTAAFADAQLGTVDFSAGSAGDSNPLISAGAFNDCTIGLFKFGPNTVVQAAAFNVCSFTSIDLSELTTFVASVEEGTGVIFRDCPTLGTVNFHGVTTIGPLVNSRSTKTTITIQNLGAATIQAEAFRYLNIQNDVTILTGSTLGESAFRDAVINGTLTLQDNLTIPFNCFTSSTITLDLVTGDSVTVNGKNEDSINYGAFYVAKINGNAVFGESNKFNNNAFRAAQISGNLTFGKNANFAGEACFRGVTIRGKVEIKDGFQNGNQQLFYSAYIYGDITIGSGTFASNAFASATLGTAAKPITVNLSSGTVLGGSCFSGSIYADFNFADGITVSSTAPISANIHGTVSIGEITFTSRASDCEGLFGYARTNGSGYTVDNVVLRESCKTIPALLLASAHFGRVEIQGNEVTIGARAFLHARVDLIVGMNNVVSIGENAFGYEYSGKGSYHVGTPPRTAVTAGMDLSNVTSIGANAFEGFTFNGSAVINGNVTIGKNAFLKATIHSDFECKGTADIGESAFQQATINGDFICHDETTIATHAFSGASIKVTGTDSEGKKLGGNLTLGDGTIPKPDTELIVTIADNAFSGFTTGTDDATTTIPAATIEGDVLFGYKTQIGANAFNGVIIGDANVPDGVSVELKDTTLYNGETQTWYSGIGEHAFTNAFIYGSFTFGSGVEEIPADAFTGVRISGTLDFGETVSTIGNSAFENATLKSPLTVPANVETIVEEAFLGLTLEGENTELVFEGDVTLEPRSFFGSTITEINFESTGIIEAEAFAEGEYGTINLGYVTKIGGIYDATNGHKGAFRAAKIDTINFEDACVPAEGSTTMLIKERAFSGATIGYLNFSGTARALVGDKRDDKLDVHGQYSPFKGASIARLNLNDVTTVGYGYFANITIEKVDLINTPIEFQNHALNITVIKDDLIFNGPVTLTNYTFSPKSASSAKTTIDGDLIFNGGVTLKTGGDINAIIVKGDLIIKNLSGSGNFLGKPGNTNAAGKSTIEGSLIIDQTSDLNCTFTSVTIGGDMQLNGVRTIGEAAFRSSTIKGNALMNSVKTIGRQAFYLSKIQGNVHADAVTSIGNSAFYQSTFSDSTLEFPLVTTIGTLAFYHVTFAQNTVLNLPEATSIGSQAFEASNYLYAINVPKVTSISGSAFKDCESLVKIDLPALQTIGGSVFSGCGKLTKVSIGSQLTSWSTGNTDTFNGSSVQIVVLETPFEYTEDSETGALVPEITGTIGLPANAVLMVPRGENVVENGENIGSNELKYRAYFTAHPDTPLWGSVTEEQVETIQFVIEDVASGITYLVERVGDNANEVEIVGMIGVTEYNLENGRFTFPSTLTRTEGETSENFHVVSISSSAMQHLNGYVGTQVNTIVLPDKLAYINFSGLDTPTALTAYEISANNTAYDTIDGILYSEGRATLVLYPNGKQDLHYDVGGIAQIGEYAFAGNGYLQTVTIAGTVVISDGAFQNCRALTRISFTGTGSAVFIGRDTVKGCVLMQAGGITYATGYTLVVPYDTELLRYVATSASGQ